MTAVTWYIVLIAYSDDPSWYAMQYWIGYLFSIFHIVFVFVLTLLFVRKLFAVTLRIAEQSQRNTAHLQNSKNVTGDQSRGRRRTVTQRSFFLKKKKKNTYIYKYIYVYIYVYVVIGRIELQKKKKKKIISDRRISRTNPTFGFESTCNDIYDDKVHVFVLLANDSRLVLFDTILDVSEQRQPDIGAKSSLHIVERLQLDSGLG
ncbi:hypothetical protein RFI_13073 [Reticulomyxa filosa]|uniref:Uncharacterized protein n=1 Tax=Reticulomyxa filosa TaxID=46433 RepID=X6NDK6_RETFI|nr:hypothetical protein RFI_13073 [Reticulomyxa filosa]|eukprot:ETO24086.1 hypothetical protein RFI_13073 [Reticulomyxa filosa]